MLPNSAPGRVLVADDQADVRVALGMLMRQVGLETDAAGTLDEVRHKLASGSYDLLLLDLNYARDTTSGREGLELLAEVHARDPLLPVVVMTGWGGVETAVEAMRRGARSFVHKPWDNAALADAICREVDEGRAARLAAQRSSRERSDAQAIQRALLPSTLPTVPGCALAARWMPASAFGGDCYDVVRMSDGRVAISIADVCGKGLAAALVMANLQASVRAFASVDPAPQAVAASVNRALMQNDGLRRFVTFFYAVYDAATRDLTFVNAGHNPPLIVAAGGAMRRLTAGGPVLGVFEQPLFQQGRERLASGDRLVLFTDGIVECENGDGDALGDERVAAAVLQGRADGASTLVDRIVDDVTRFADGPLQDDATVVVLSVS